MQISNFSAVHQIRIINQQLCKIVNKEFYNYWTVCRYLKALQNESKISFSMVLDGMLDMFEQSYWMMLDGKKMLDDVRMKIK